MGYSMENQKEAQRLEFQAKQRNYSLETELSHLNLKTHKKVLDLGCGTGLMARYLLDENSKLQVSACDYSEVRIQQAKNLSKGYSIDFFHGDAQNLKIQKKFDLIISRYVFEHLENPEQAARSVYDALEVGGTGYLIDFDGIFLNLYTANDKFNQQLNAINSAVNFDLYIGRKLPALLKSVGFKNIQWRAEINTFEGPELAEEKHNCAQRCQNAYPLLEKLLGSNQEAEMFIENYVDSLDFPETVLFYNKFIAWGEK
ncbi:MAG: methyltransferase domain-containing protein [Halobacteriovoraceae bacterium]|nr:methyltransferase domain-containing protein [Halobacteriovoraceae bacterium]MCB9095149.1 methyltransferase domain-containing protein [Halobacteriovoraceae bacterium]